MNIFKTKIAFHEQRINTPGDLEEDIKKPEKKILQLQTALSNAIKEIKENGETDTCLNAHTVANTTPRFTQ